MRECFNDRETRTIRAADQTQKQVFIASYAATGDTVVSAAAAGVSTAQALDLLGKRGLRDSIRRETARMLEQSILPLAAARHHALLSDPETHGPSLLKAIELAYRHGFAAREDEDDRPLSELTADELEARAARGRALIAALQREASDRAKPVIDAAGRRTGDDDGDEGVFC